MAFFEDDEEDYSWFTENEPEIDENAFIADSEQAAQLISELFRSGTQNDRKMLSHIQQYIKDIFQLYSEIELEDELSYYQEFRTLYNRLAERRKLEKISKKTVIGIGGKFSAGKSKFLNAVAGLDGLLPEATSPTTSIPTYIISGKTAYIANNIYDGMCSLTKEKLQAMTHEFFEKYHIGFSAFVESIVITSQNWSLPTNLALLDTPGYNKYDNKIQDTVSDKMKAYEQLKNADFLIWLASIDNGTITQDDIHFIESLHLSFPVLIVFNKCDQKTPEQVASILEQAVSDIENAGLDCYGVAAYSALYKEETNGRYLKENRKYSGNLIQDFLKYASESNQFSNDIYSQFCKLETNFKNVIEQHGEKINKTVKELEKFIQESENVMAIRSLSQVWSKQTQERNMLFRKSKECERLFAELNQKINAYLKGETA